VWGVGSVRGPSVDGLAAGVGMVRSAAAQAAATHFGIFGSWFGRGCFYLVAHEDVAGDLNGIKRCVATYTHHTTAYRKKHNALACILYCTVYHMNHLYATTFFWL